jgi:DNA-binding beta-propeller fold protein YncE
MTKITRFVYLVPILLVVFFFLPLSLVSVNAAKETLNEYSMGGNTSGKPRLFAGEGARATLAQSLPNGQHLLYVASPGVRNYTEYGGVGLLVFDIDHGYKFVRRIPTWEIPEGQKPQNVKGIAASAKTGVVYVTSLTHMIAIDAVTGKTIWDKTYEGGCDRMAISPDGKILYVPQFEGTAWHVVDAATGGVIGTIETNSGSHNTIYSADGERVYLAGLRSPLLSVANARTQKLESTVGPFDNVIRPFTVNASNTLVFVNINGLLGFEVGDLRTGKKLYHVEVEGYKQGPVKRHGCPSHGIALTPDEKELWLADCANNAIHVFDATVMPPKQVTSIKAQDCVGWISFSMDGRFAYSSTGEIIDVKTRKVVATLQDEAGRPVQSEKMFDLTIADGKVIHAGNQFGVGMK